MLAAKVVSVVGGGWSFLEVDQSRLPGIVIAANEAAVALERVPEMGVSMDRLWTENRWAQISARKMQFFGRRSALQNIKPLPNWAFSFENEQGRTLGETAAQLNGTNSGECALNLAYVLRPNKVYLFGFDMTRGPAGEPYWHAPYPWAPPQGSTKPAKYAEWTRRFRHVADHFRRAGIEVLNVSSRSLINAFPRVHPAQIGVAR